MIDRRQYAYLKTMGVDCYVPKSPLLAAKPSFFYAENRSSQAVLSSSIDTVALRKPAAATRDLRHLVNDLVSENLPVSVDHKVTSVVSDDDKTRKSTGKVVSIDALVLNLRLVVCGEFLLVDSVPLDGDLAAQHLRLLNNILFALCGTNKQRTNEHQFHWPPTKISDLQESKRAAVETLSGLLNSVQFNSTCQFLILMGESAHNIFASISYENKQAYKTISAVDCLSDAELKRRIWTDLKSLRNIDANSSAR